MGIGMGILLLFYMIWDGMGILLLLLCTGYGLWWIVWHVVFWLCVWGCRELWIGVKWEAVYKRGYVCIVVYLLGLGATFWVLTYENVILGGIFKCDKHYIKNSFFIRSNNK